MILKTLIVAIYLILLVSAQQCRNNQGWRVDWWVMLSFPNSASTGFAYFDSRSASPSLRIFTEEPDTTGTPLVRTLQQISTYNMQNIAWNDQIYNQSESTVLAHSKSIGAYDKTSKQGFLIVHSIPEYPKFNDLIINIKIDNSQQIYGQHLLCISGNKTFMLQIINKLIPIRPQKFALNYDCMSMMSEFLHNFNNIVPDYDSLFSYMNYQKNGSMMNFIFKNGYKNSSIFEDGLINMFNSSILSQTWGRPLQEPWCGPNYTTGNILEIAVNSSITWKTSQDHSKWLIAIDKNVSCFGDMNRMSSQWKRGGAYYCITSTLLNQALNSIIKTKSTCSQQQSPI